ncbi:MAG: universal stress protein, partial [Acetobacteraceae bacterium]|nr:universal stress protein [Acetobacteraceae bacterium]
LISQARAADLVVVGRPGPDDALDPRLRVPPGPLLMGLGRPVLLAPPRVERLSAARVVVAWKDTRETRRAVLDGLPLVRTAEAVFVVVVGEGESGGEGRDGAADVAAYLARHGAASATVLRPEPGGSVADTLQQTARREGADLIVAGAYGHSRLRQWVFGGVTRDLLGNASICCLLSR